MNKIKIFVAIFAAVLVASFPRSLGGGKDEAEKALSTLKSETYVVRASKGKIGLYINEEKGERLILSAPINTASLREVDRISLEKGVLREGRAEALMLFEDFLG